MQRNTLAALIAGLFTLPVQADTIPTLDEIVVTATRIPTPDIVAPYASEVHTRRAIEQSGAATLYDYLAQHTSVQVLPSYGNRFTPLMEMRGYGTGNGYQNIAITLDGRRLNNIDGSPQLIGAIPLADIERIEITKGSGSVLYGDGATAGSIQIITRAHAGVTVQGSAGNHGAQSATVTAGLKKEQISLNASADYSRLDGYSHADPSGHADASGNRSWRGGIEFRPLEALTLGLDLAGSRIDARYVSPLTLAQFNADPAQPGSNPWVFPANAYNHQKFESDVWRVSGKWAISPALRLTASHSREDKLADWVSYASKSNYDYDADDIALQYHHMNVDLAVGYQTFDGVRVSTTNLTRKDNQGYYLQGQYHLAGMTISAGARRESIDYTYAPTVGASASAGNNLTAWDLGLNQPIDARLSWFANINRAFQAPDIDRFFNFGGGFNGFITPAISRTLNLGLNHVTPANRLKLTLFRANLAHEIYYNALTFTNTNLDKTHKYGLELQDAWRATETLSASLNYTWTRAIIDRENDGGGAYNGKELPGVPRHGAVLGLNWQASPTAHIGLTHTWRASTYATDDFANNFNQKQAAYQSTDLILRYRLKDLEWFAAVDNLFERRNGLWTHDDAIYPVSFTRNWRLGMKATF